MAEALVCHRRERRPRSVTPGTRRRLSSLVKPWARGTDVVQRDAERDVSGVFRAGALCVRATGAQDAALVNAGGGGRGCPAETGPARRVPSPPRSCR
jgi:hypothetical protein